MINGYVEHAREITRPGDCARRYAASRNLAIGRESCFVVTAAGLAILAASEIVVSSRGGDAGAAASLLPRWDAAERLLILGGRVVKQYLVPSPNQQAVLAAFQEEGWPRSIDDPLPFMPGRRPKERLHATIRCLNANQQNRLVRFRGNGTGEAVLWEPIAASAPARNATRLRLRRAA